MGNLVCDWLAATEGHAQAAEGTPPQALQAAAAGAADLSASHFLRVQWLPFTLRLPFTVTVHVQKLYHV